MLLSIFKQAGIKLMLPNSSPAKILFLCSTFALFPLLITGQRPGFKVPQCSKGRFYSVSTHSPIARHMNQFETFKKSAKIITQFLEESESNILRFLRGGVRPGSSQKFGVCNVWDNDYINTLRNKFGLKGLPEPATSCLTELLDTTFYSDTKPNFAINQVYDAILTRSSLIKRERENIVRKTLLNWEGRDLLSDWSQPDGTFNYPYKRGSRECVIHPTGSVRVKTHWYSVTLITNELYRKSLPLLHRQYVQEYTRVDATGQVRSLRIILPKYNASHPKYNASHYGLPISIVMEPQVNTTTVFSLDTVEAQAHLSWHRFQYMKIPRYEIRLKKQIFLYNRLTMR